MSEPTNRIAGADRELLETALAINDPDDWDYSNIVTELQTRGGLDILTLAINLCHADEESKQILGVLVLAQLGVQAGTTFVEESLPTVLELCEETTSPYVLQWGISALGHFADRRGLPTMYKHLRHSDRWVRYFIASALPFAAGDPPEPSAIDALIVLMSDESSFVRDWATFGLGTTVDVDNPEIRSALWARVEDEDPETVFEALRGLGSRHVLGVVDRIVELLQRPKVSSYFIDAAIAVPDKRLVGPLKEILAHGWDDEDITPEWLALVIEGCENVEWTERP